MSRLTRAQNPEATSDSLWEIKGADLSGLDELERADLIRALIDHPNSDEELCLELFSEYPKEALACSRFQLMLLSESVSWEEIFRNAFDDFSEVIPALPLLACIPRLYQPTLNLFEAYLLERLDNLDCSFDWRMDCTHDVSVEWNPCLFQ